MLTPAEQERAALQKRLAELDREHENAQDTLPRISDERLEQLAKDRSGNRIRYGIYGPGNPDVPSLRTLEALSLVDEVRRARAWAKSLKEDESKQDK